MANSANRMTQAQENQPEADSLNNNGDKEAEKWKVTVLKSRLFANVMAEMLLFHPGQK